MKGRRPKLLPNSGKRFDTGDWLIFNPDTQALECTRCGALHWPGFPLRLEILLQAGQDFLALHRDCEPASENQGSDRSRELAREGMVRA
jgi:hypothetical protein